jgi:ferredoxin
VAGGLVKAGFHLGYGFGRKRVDSSRCTGCAACVQVCPVGNIRLDLGHVRIGGGCADCFGCLHACPVSAISFGRLSVTPATRYRSPLSGPACPGGPERVSFGHG